MELRHQNNVAPGNQCSAAFSHQAAITVVPLLMMVKPILIAQNGALPNKQTNTQNERNKVYFSKHHTHW